MAKSTTNAQASRYFGIDESNIRKWRKDELKTDGFKSSRAKYAELEERLYEWYLESPHVTGKMLQEKAAQLALEFPEASDFRVSQGWLQRFKMRYNI